jgi:4-hydroxy-3-methylbut-2-enyl diphosphate reductase IspH
MHFMRTAELMFVVNDVNSCNVSCMFVEIGERQGSERLDAEETEEVPQQQTRWMRKK